MTSASPHAVRPSSVSLAQKLMYALAALSVLGLIATFTGLDAIRETATADGLDADTVATGAIIGGVIGTIISIVVWVLLGVFTGRGKNWARIVATVLAVLGIILGLFTLGGGALELVVGVITLVIYVALLVLLWRKESSAFFKDGGSRQTVADPGYPQV